MHKNRKKLSCVIILNIVMILAPEIKTSNEQFTVLHIMALQGSDADDRIMQNLSPDSQKTISINVSHHYIHARFK